ncbi:MAG: HD domain-containing protein [Anaerolineae bacterium]|nr:HD domain-containing protein [Anaerolineae bacterium]
MPLSMSENSLSKLKDWFTNYAHTFQYSEPDLQQNIDLKEEHTLRVCKEIIHIGKQLDLNDDELRLAEIIALLHDVGRFEQYARYKTFLDSKSENHAELGVKILGELGILEILENNTKDIILKAIQYHNRSALPQGIQGPCLFYAKLIRDADKLDIWKVVTDYYYRKDSRKNGAIELGLPDTPGFSKEVYCALLNKNIVSIEHVRNLNDFKLLQIGWIFDINFQPTLDCIKSRGYLQMIRDVLPASKDIDDILDNIYSSYFC